MNTNTSTRSPENVRKHPTFYWVLWFCGLAIVGMLLFVAWRTWGDPDPLFDKFNITFKSGPTAMLLAVIYLVLSLKKVGADDTAGAYCYGKALVHLVSGLHFVPFGFMQWRRESRTVQEFQCPDEPENVFKGDDKDPLPRPDMVRPIRVVTRAPKTDAKGILDAQMSFVVSFVFQYVVTDIFDYVANFGSTKIVRVQLRDIGETTVAEYTTTKTTSEFIVGLPELNKKLHTDVQQRFQHSGVAVISARLISPDITHKVSEALANIPIARAESAQMEIRADGARAKLTKEGEGAANAELSMLKARATGQKQMKDDLGVEGDVIVAAEAIRGILDTTNVLVMGQSGMADAMGFVKAAQAAFESGKGGRP